MATPSISSPQHRSFSPQRLVMTAIQSVVACHLGVLGDAKVDASNAWSDGRSVAGAPCFVATGSQRLTQPRARRRGGLGQGTATCLRM